MKLHHTYICSRCFIFVASGEIKRVSLCNIALIQNDLHASELKGNIAYSGNVNARNFTVHV